MSPTTLCRIAGFLVLGLVITSLPVRVWVFGACPVCGKFHSPIFVAYVGAMPEDPNPDSDPPNCPDDGHFFHSCCAPFPYCPTAPAAPETCDRTANGEVHPESDPRTDSVPTAALIRPPRSQG